MSLEDFKKSCGVSVISWGLPSSPLPFWDLQTPLCEMGPLCSSGLLGRWRTTAFSGKENVIVPLDLHPAEGGDQDKKYFCSGKGKRREPGWYRAG